MSISLASPCCHTCPNWVGTTVIWHRSPTDLFFVTERHHRRGASTAAGGEEGHDSRRSGVLRGDGPRQPDLPVVRQVQTEEAQILQQASISLETYYLLPCLPSRRLHSPLSCRVHTGFEWNKYNQTHYDMDNPPPKIVQGYKFNIFYPDLIDKNTTPEYFLVSPHYVCTKSSICSSSPEPTQV